MNSIVISGNIGKAIEIKQAGETTIGKFSLAVKDNRKDKNGEYHTNWINCVVFGKQAEVMAQYTDKGSKLTIRGKLKTGDYMKGDVKIYTTDVIVEEFDFGDKAGEVKQKKVAEPEWTPMEDSDSLEDMLPF